MTRRTLSELRQCLPNSNVQAWLRVVRTGETDPDDDDAYHAVFGWSVKTKWPRAVDLADHPRKAIKSSYGWTSAAGAYQAMAAVPPLVQTDTWGDFVAWCGRHSFRPSFIPADQDVFALWCTDRRGALDDVINGRVEQAIKKCNREWASLPGSPYGQPRVTLARLLLVYARFGGTLNAPAPMGGGGGASLGSPPAPEAPSVAEAPTPAPTAPATAGHPAPSRPPATDEWSLNNPEPTMDPLTIGLATSLISAFSPLLREKAEKELSRHASPEIAAQVAQSLVGAAQQATKLADPVAAVATAKADPAVLQVVEQTAADELAKLGPVLDRLVELERQERKDTEASRDAAAARASRESGGQDEFLTLSIVRMMVGVLVGLGLLAAALKALGVDVQAIVGTILTLVGVIGREFSARYQYRYGSSSGSGAKDVIIERLAKKG